MIGDITWDANDWVVEQNKFNEAPTEGMKYIMVPVEVTYRGAGEFTPYAWWPGDYVDTVGNAYEDAGVVTPQTRDRPTVTDGGTATLYWVYMVPVDTPEGGQFVIADGLPLDEALEEGQWVNAT